MISVRCFRNTICEEVADPDEISDYVDAGTLVWVDLVEPTEDELTCVRDEFSLHPLAMEDIRKHGQRPKLERYADHAFLVAYSGDRAEVDVFVGPKWMVTSRAPGPEGTPWPIDELLQRYTRTDGATDDPDVGMLLYTLLDTLVDGYFDHTEGAEDRLEDLENRIFSDDATDETAIQQDLFAVRRRLLEFRRIVVPLRDVVSSLLRQEVPWVQGEALVRLQDVFDHLLRATDFIDSMRELMGNAVDAHLAIISNRMNRVMKMMTSWGAILFGTTLVAGIYGMNFKHMPELDWYYGYPMALGIMAALTLVLRHQFRKRDWL